MRNRVLTATDPTGHRDLALDQGGGGGLDIRLLLLSKGEAEKALKSIGQTAVTTASFIPGVGDAIDVYDFMAALYRGEYGEAGFVLAAAALPGSARAARNVGGEVVERIARNLDEATEGIAVIKAYGIPPGGQLPHFSIEVRHGNSVFETEQVIRSRDLSSTTINNVMSPQSPVRTTTVALPNAREAQDFQRSSIGNELGLYGLSNNCVTHVCDVLRAGGAVGAPHGGSGLRDIRYIRVDLRMDEVFRGR